MIRLFAVFALCVCFGSMNCQAAEPTESYDVVIYGGTSSGWAAAIQATRMGKSVIVIEPSLHLGGLTSGGLGWTDSGNKAVIGGVAREFYQQVKKHYDDPQAWKYVDRAKYPQYRAGDDAMWTFEPSVAEAIMKRMAGGNAGISIVYGQRLLRTANGIEMRDGRITSITMEGAITYRGKMFIDATYEGDLMALAGVSYTVGRESNAKYGETLNGVAKKYNNHMHRFVVAVDPYVVPGDPSSGLLPGVHDDPPGEDGTGDQRVQAYCYRMCMSNVAENRVPFPKPDEYDEPRYELLLRNFEAGDLRLPLKPDMMPNGKTDTNNNCAFSTDNIGMNYDYPEADYERRAEILEEHRVYQQGLMWTLANHPRVPQSIRQKMSVWGLAKDEFTDTNNWPHQIYVREARRMVGDYVMTEADCRMTRNVEDSIGMGSYNMDSHNCQRYITPEGHVQNEGDVQVSPGGPYRISYRAIVPKKDECENLLVPVCLSSSHIAYGSIRMEPVFMTLGQSAATAACQAIDERIAVQGVKYEMLRERLLADKQVLEHDGPRRVANIGIDPAKLPGIVVDDAQAELIGDWVPSTATPGFVGQHYLHDNNEEKGKAVVFRAKLPKSGRYKVRLAYTANSNRATNAGVEVIHGGNSTSQKVNQRKSLERIDDPFVSLGEFQFEADTPAVVIINNEDADGHVIADAVQWIPVKGEE